jgi:hypothetical protein
LLAAIVAGVGTDSEWLMNSGIGMKLAIKIIHDTVMINMPVMNISHFKATAGVGPRWAPSCSHSS